MTNKENEPAKDSEDRERGRKQNESQKETVKDVENGKGICNMTNAKECS